MRLRFTMILGVAVVTEDTGEIVGTVSGFLPHPDTGRIEGFFVDLPGMFQHDVLFLLTRDIRSWGIRITVRDSDVLFPPEEQIRLQSLLEDSRPIVGQRIITETGAYVGRCRDVQFDTRYFQIEWLFPKRWARWRVAFPVTEIIEIRREAIVIKDQKALGDVKVAEEGGVMKLPEMA